MCFASRKTSVTSIEKSKTRGAPKDLKIKRPPRPKQGG